MPTGSKNIGIVVLIVGVVIMAALSNGINYYEPVKFNLDLVSTNISYETFQSWSIHLDDNTRTTSYSSAKKTYSFPLSFSYEASVTGRLYYVEVQIPIKQVGQLPSENLLSGSCTPSTWYNQIEVYGHAKVYLQDEAHFVGETDLVPVRFGPRDLSETTRNLVLYLGSHNGVKYVKANYQWGTTAPIDIESYLGTLGISGTKEFVLYVKVIELLTVYKIKPCLAGAGAGESTQIEKEVSSPEIPGSVRFSLPVTWTGTWVSTTTWQTQTNVVGCTSQGQVCTGQWTINPTTVIIPPTTIGTNTFTGVSTTFTGWHTDYTWTNTPPPTDWCSIPTLGPILCWQWWSWLDGSTFGIPNWLILVGVVIIILYLLFGRGGSGITIVLGRDQV